MLYNSCIIEVNSMPTNGPGVRNYRLPRVRKKGESCRARALSGAPALVGPVSKLFILTRCYSRSTGLAAKLKRKMGYPHGSPA